MGYSHGNCEIVEANNEFSTYQKLHTHSQVEQEREQSPPVIKKGDSRCLEDDINKLFEAVNVRTSKSLDLSDSWRNALKRPMRSPGLYSPGIGLSEPVSLKQALRGLCISQAAEMAAMKRLSMQSASPRISEGGKSSNSCRSLVIEARVSGCFQAVTEESRMETHFMAEERTPVIKNTASSPVCNDKQVTETVHSLEGKHNLLSALPHHDSLDNVSLPDSNLSGQSKVASGPFKDSVTPLEAVKMAGTKLRRKSKLQNLPPSSGSKSNKGAKSATNLPRPVKPVIRNKNLIIKKSKKVVTSNDGYSKSPYEVYSGLDQGSGHLICQRCQCALRDTNMDSSNNPPAATSITNSNTKLIEKGDTSQSWSSICDFSSSTTSLSEDSSLSGAAYGSRPHMSKDVRWGEISRLSEQYGSLGLSLFNLLKKLGSGDIGTVYLAELIGTNCLFAIKVTDNEYLARRGKMLRAQTEGEILRMLDHPFLPTLYAKFTSDNLSCLVMEFCPGGDLHVLRQKQPGRCFPEQEARFYVAEVLLALEYLHMLGIVYRDLKPENILIRADGHIMLTDFDLSLRCSVNPTLVKSSPLKMVQPRISGPCAGSNCIDPFCSGPSCKVSCFSPRLFPTTARERKPRLLPELVAEPTEARSNSFVGTHEYLAPEIINGESHGSAVDWWTFGVLLYELLYGKTPFKGAGNGETLSNAVLQPLRFPDSPMISLEARDLIRGLLVKEAENRLGAETGAAEIKRHPFFEGMNWALIRCAIPPQIPEMYDVGNPVQAESTNEKGSAEGEHLLFELF